MHTFCLCTWVDTEEGLSDGYRMVKMAWYIQCKGQLGRYQCDTRDTRGTSFRIGHWCVALERCTAELCYEIRGKNVLGVWYSLNKLLRFANILFFSDVCFRF